MALALPGWAAGCVPCDFGTMPLQDPSKPIFYPKECMPCGFKEESSRCRVCSMGQGLNANGVCEDCAPGTYSGDFAGVCSPCPADSYSPGLGSTLCIKCTDLGDYYQVARAWMPFTGLVAGKAT